MIVGDSPRPSPPRSTTSVRRTGPPCPGWRERDVPDQSGRVIVVTGASAGLGLENARTLAAARAHVVMATRDAKKTRHAADRVRRAVPDASLEHVPLDLADLVSVADAADRIRAVHPHVDALICNAGLMATPLRRTVDGFELQLGVNHLGHAALVAHLLPVMRAAPNARVVVVSSQMHLLGRIELEDLNFERRRYRRWSAYSQSKLANLLHVHELSRRLAAAAASVTVVAAHPGYARTELQGKGPTMQGGVSGAVSALLASTANTVIGQPAATGALPQLFAATAPDLPRGSYWGPSGPAGLRGPVGPAPRSRAAQDDGLARRLWRASEDLVGFPLAPVAQDARSGHTRR